MKKKLTSIRKGIIILCFILFSLNLFVFKTPSVSATADDVLVLSGDIIKNFKFESIGSEPIVDGSAYNGKLRFEDQSVWRLTKDQVHFIGSHEDGGITYLRYKIMPTTRINIFTNVLINQMSETFKPVTESLEAGYYKHYRLGAIPQYDWTQYIEWEHWEFGDIRTYNLRNNVFEGTVVMSFDINANPLPAIFGNYAEKQFDYIAVSSAGVISATRGKMSEDMPTITGATPAEYDSGKRKDYIGDDIGGQGTENGDFNHLFDPMTFLSIDSEPSDSFDVGIRTQLSGSMRPTTKAGGAIWDPEDTERSMTDAKIKYNLYSLSPIVYEYKARLSWFKQHLETEDWLEWFNIIVIVRRDTQDVMTENRQVALHGINRYIQVEMYVAFDIWTAVKLGALTEEYEYMKLHFPEEYYDELIWSSLVGGWGGSHQKTGTPPPFDPFGWLEDIFGGFFGDIFSTVLTIVLVAVGLYIFIRIGIPLIRRKIDKRPI